MNSGFGYGVVSCNVFVAASLVPGPHQLALNILAVLWLGVGFVALLVTGAEA